MASITDELYLLTHISVLKLLNEMSITEFAWTCTLNQACKIYDQKGYCHMTWILQMIV